MSDSIWKLSVRAPKRHVHAALLAHETMEENGLWDADLAITGREIAEDRPDDWVLEAYFPRRPDRAQERALAALFGAKRVHIEIERQPQADWLALSQAGLEPIRAGRFHVRTPDHPPPGQSGIVDLAISASQAFGTGQHETTAGCLAMLDRMKRLGARPRRIADIGTGTGLLAFAALRLWPQAEVTASDIDPVCAGVVQENAARNRINLGARRGELAMVIAAGTDHPLLEIRGPYELLIANILAGPLIALAPDFARAVAGDGQLVLAGLLATQERAVLRAYRRAGFRLAAREQRGDWSILRLRKRRAGDRDAGAKPWR